MKIDMRDDRKMVGAALLLVASLISSCAPANGAGPDVPASQASESVVHVESVAPVETEVARSECPTGTTWEGDQCVLPPAPEPTATAAPEPEPSAAATVAAITPTSFQVENGALKLPGPVLFETGKDTLRPASDPVLELVKAYLVAKPMITVLRIEGHTDNLGNSAANQALSEKRALSCARWLVAHGVDCKRLLPVGFGDAKPIAPNNTADGRAMNRRMSFVNAALKGKPIGGLPLDGGGKVAGNACAPPP
jgi:OOP family OmpA-OmpF porin